MTKHNHVILSKAKDLKVYVTVDGRTDCEILRYAQDDKPKRPKRPWGTRDHGDLEKSQRNRQKDEQTTTTK